MASFSDYLNVILQLTLGHSSFTVLVSVRGAKPNKNVHLNENEVRGLCLKSREIFLSQPILLELEAPLKICGKLLHTHICRAIERLSLSLSL
jgi:hypothetical protein